jgi:hypothetical protein
MRESNKLMIGLRPTCPTTDFPQRSSQKMEQKMRNNFSKKKPKNLERKNEGGTR